MKIKNKLYHKYVTLKYGTIHYSLMFNGKTIKTYIFYTPNTI